MARERMVTRTINVMCLDVVTCDVSIKTFTLTGETYEKEKALKELKKTQETDTLKLVEVVRIETIEELYGMKENDFLLYAKKLDNETRKMIEE